MDELPEFQQQVLDLLDAAGVALSQDAQRRLARQIAEVAFEQVMLEIRAAARLPAGHIGNRTISAS